MIKEEEQWDKPSKSKIFKSSEIFEEKICNNCLHSINCGKLCYEKLYCSSLLMFKYTNEGFLND